MSFMSTPTAKKRLLAEEFLENEIQWVEHYNLQPEGAQSGLDATATGVKYTGVTSVYVDPQMVRHAKYVYLEFAIDTLASGAGVKCHLYDRDDAADIASSAEITATTDRTRVTIAVATLEAAMGHELTVRWEVTTAAGSGTFTATSARLVIIKGVS